MHCTYLPHPIKLSIPTSSEPEKEKREKKEKERKKANDLTDEIIHILDWFGQWGWNSVVALNRIGDRGE